MLSEQSPQQPSFGMLRPGCLSGGQAARAVEQFLRLHLPDWVAGQQRHPQRSENPLTVNLCLFLCSRCRQEPTLFQFFHQSPQAGRHIVDIGVYPFEEGISVANQMYRLDDVFYTLEAKRLPTPGTGREREYVVGNGAKQSGGIERFKENLHGDRLLYSGMIAYIQEDRKPSWLANINQWLADLATHPPTNAHATWGQNDLLRQETTATPRVREFSSHHHRAHGSPIQLETVVSEPGLVWSWKCFSAYTGVLTLFVRRSLSCSDPVSIDPIPRKASPVLRTCQRPRSCAVNATPHDISVRTVGTGPIAIGISSDSCMTAAT